jgi:hypothetical protein
MCGLGLYAFAYVLLRLWRRESIGPIIWSGILAFAIIGIAYVPALPLLARLVDVEAKFMSPAAPFARLVLLNKIVFKYPGYGLGDAGLIIAGVAGIGVIWAAFRSPRALLFFLCVFLAPALLYGFFGLARASSAARYTLPLMPSYAVAIGAGLAAITFGIEALARRSQLDAGRAGAIATIVLAAALVLLSATPLSKLYAASQSHALSIFERLSAICARKFSRTTYCSKPVPRRAGTPSGSEVMTPTISARPLGRSNRSEALSTAGCFRGRSLTIST